MTELAAWAFWLNVGSCALSLAVLFHVAWLHRWLIGENAIHARTVNNNVRDRLGRL